MRLVDLNPQWLWHQDRRVGLVFKCPHCQKTYLSCFFECFPTLSWDEGDPVSQYDLIKARIGEGDGAQAVPCNPKSAWKCDPAPMSATFENMTIEPSLNAEASGHWHGKITGGKIC